MEFINQLDLDSLRPIYSTEDTCRWMLVPLGQLEQYLNSGCSLEMVRRVDHFFYINPLT